MTADYLASRIEEFLSSEAVEVPILNFDHAVDRLNEEVPDACPLT